MFIVCVCVPVKIQFNNTSTCNYPLARSLCSLAQLPPPPPLFKYSGSAPE